MIFRLVLSHEINFLAGESKNGRISCTLFKAMSYLLLRLLLLLYLFVLSLPTNVNVLAILIADRPTFAAKHLARSQSYCGPRVLIPSRRIDVPAEIDFGDDGGRRRRQRALPLLEVAESRRDRRQLVAIGAQYRLRGLNTAGKASGAI